MLVGIASVVLLATSAWKDECKHRKIDTQAGRLPNHAADKSPIPFEPKDEGCDWLGCDFSVAVMAGCEAKEKGVGAPCQPKGTMTKYVELGLCNVCDTNYTVGKGEQLMQDAWLVHCSKTRRQCVYAVTDGHGSYGEEVSSGVIHKLYEELDKGRVTIDKEGKWIQGFIDRYDQTLSKDSMNDIKGGSTIAGAVVLDGAVHVFHAGDSRVVVADNTGTLVFGTTDHTWGLADERDRAIKHPTKPVHPKKPGPQPDPWDLNSVPYVRKAWLDKKEAWLDKLRLQPWGLMPSRGIGDISAKKWTGAVFDNRKKGTGGLAKTSVSGFSNAVEYNVLPDSWLLGKVVIASHGVFDKISSTWKPPRAPSEWRLAALGRRLRWCRQAKDKSNDAVLHLLNEQGSTTVSLVQKSREAMEGYTESCEQHVYIDDMTAITINLGQTERA